MSNPTELDVKKTSQYGYTSEQHRNFYDKYMDPVMTAEL